MKTLTSAEWKEVALMFTMQFVSYLLLVVNYRAVTQTRYFSIAWTDFAIASMGFFVFRRIAKNEANSISQWLGYASGGMVGSLLGVFLSHYFGM